MKATVRTMSLVALLCLLPRMYSADIAGAWKGTFEFNGSSMPIELHLKTAGTGITGTVEGLPTSPAEIHDGKIEGSAISFWLKSDYQGQTYKLIYKGKIAADEIDFSFGTDDGSWGTTVTMKKEDAAEMPVADVTGVWKGAFDFNGNSMALTFNLKSSGAAVSGTIEGLGRTPVEIHDGKVDGDTVTFWLNADYQGQTYAVTYKGKVTPGQIDFTFGTPDGGWSSSVVVKKS